MTFDFFTFWGEGRNKIEDEIKTDIKTIIMELVGWLEFDRNQGNVIADLEYDPNNPILNMIISAHMIQSLMEHNQVLPEDRQIALGQNNIDIKQQDENMDVSIEFYILNNLKKISMSVPIII